jgi:hypothetical protein
MSRTTRLRHSAVAIFTAALAAFSCSGIPLDWETVTIEDETFEWRRSPLTRVVQIRFDAPEVNGLILQLVLDIKCTDGVVFTRLNDVRIASGQVTRKQWAEISALRARADSAGWVRDESERREELGELIGCN